MTRSKRNTFVAGAAGVALFALALAGCTSASQAGGSAPESNGAGQGTVDVATSGLGQILVDSQGRTLYLFAKDTGTQSECTGACASAWPPLQETGSQRSVAGQTPRSWEPPCAPTVAHRSPTPAIRSTSSRVTRIPATRTGRASWRTAPAGTRYRPRAARSRGRHRARAAGPATRRPTRFAEHGRQGAGRAPAHAHSVRSRSPARTHRIRASRASVRAGRSSRIPVGSATITGAGR